MLYSWSILLHRLQLLTLEKRSCLKENLKLSREKQRLSS